MPSQAAAVTRTDPAGAGTWVWVGTELVAAIDLTRRSEYAKLKEDERLERALQEQTAYLQRLLGVVGATVSMRLISTGTGRLSVYVVGRVHDRDPGRAHTEAAAMVARLCATPDHVKTRSVVDENVLRRILQPFSVPRGGIAQVAKPIRLGRPTRPDAHVNQYLVVEPFSRTRVTWAPLMERILTSPHPVCVCADLEAVDAPPEVRTMLEAEASRYLRLADPWERPLDFGGREQIPADAGAAGIAPLYQDALARLEHRCAWFSVTVASSAPLDPGLVEDVARAVSPPPRPTAPDTHDPQSLRTGYRVLWPASSAEHDELVRGQQSLRAPALPDPALEAELRRDVAPGGPGPGRGPLRLTRCLVDLGEATSVFRLPVAVDGHMPGLRVEAPADRVRRLADVTVPSVVLGYQGSRRNATAEVRLPLTDLPRHGFVVGTPGSGKTNSALHLCCQLWQSKVPFAVIEPVNSALDDYRWLATLDGFQDLVVLTVGDESVAPFRLNPFQVQPGATIASHVSNLLACFEAAFGLWDPLPFLYRRALTAAYRRRGLHPDDRGGMAGARWPVLADFVDCIGETTSSLGYIGEIGTNIDAAATLRAQSLAEGSCGPVLDCQTSFDMALLMRRPVVFELSPVGDNPKEQALMILLLINAMRGHYRFSRGPKEPPHVILLEEAHRVFPRTTIIGGGDQKEGNAQALAAERIAQGLAEDRKYRQSYLLIDQQVGKVSEDAYKITNLKIMHRTAADEDRKMLGSAMAMDDDQVEAAAGLSPFEAIVSHNQLDRPVTLTVPDVRADHARALGVAEAPLADDLELRDRHARLLRSHLGLARALAPYPECGPCPHKCRYRSRSESLNRDRETARRIVVSVLDENSCSRPAPQAYRDILEEIPFQRPAATTISAPAAVSWSGEDASTDRALAIAYRLCAWIHAYRALYPAPGWEQYDEDTAVAWASHVAQLLAKEGLL